ncbi:MAG: PaaI family thioesterase [Flavobacteriales bacterium]|nr:PaaI family thioesterase [Flavobacteriales bacterium]
MSIERVKESYARQGFMKALNAELISVEQGEVKITCDFTDNLTQQHGYFHAGVITTIVDTACGYAAMTMVSDKSEVLSTEFKVNFLRPARTDKLIAIGKVLKAGRTLTVCEGYVYDSSETTLIAKMTATIISVNADKQSRIEIQ